MPKTHTIVDELSRDYQEIYKQNKVILTFHQFLDLVPKGRDEDGFKLSMEWLRRHDHY